MHLTTSCYSLSGAVGGSTVGSSRMNEWTQRQSEYNGADDGPDPKQRQSTSVDQLKLCAMNAL